MCETVGITSRFSTASSFGVSYRRGSSEEVRLSIFRHTEARATSRQGDGEDQGDESEVLEHVEARGAGEEGVAGPEV